MIELKVVPVILTPGETAPITDPGPPEAHP